MTEQEYQDLLERAAEEYADQTKINECVCCGLPYTESECRHFKAGAEWARRNPGPEVQKLIKIAKIATIYLDQEICRLEYDLPESLSGYLMHLGHTLKKSLAKFDVARSEK